MINSHATFEDRIGKYKAGNTLIQGWRDYQAPNPLITKSGNAGFISTVEGANVNVVAMKFVVGEKKKARFPLCFTQYSPNVEIGILNPDCAQERIVRTLSFTRQLLPQGSSAVSSIASILNKIRPNYKGSVSKKTFTVKPSALIAVPNVAANSAAKNTGTTDLSWAEETPGQSAAIIAPNQTLNIAPNGGTILIKNLSALKQGRIQLTVNSGKNFGASPSEKTFASIDGHLSEVITLLNQIVANGTAYNPPDLAISIASLTALRDQIRIANDQVTSAMDNYGDANRERKIVYDGADGMRQRIELIKKYLASFTGGKKSAHFIEFSQAIKGT